MHVYGLRSYSSNTIQGITQLPGQVNTFTWEVGMESKGRLLRVTVIAILASAALATLPSLGAEIPYGVLLRIVHEEVALEIGLKQGYKADVLYLTLFQRPSYRYFYTYWHLGGQFDDREELAVITQKLEDYLETPRELFLIYPNPESYDPSGLMILGTRESALIRLTGDVRGEPNCYAEIELSHDEAKKLLEVLLNVLG
ncbi:hypothetical protein J7K76_01585 [Candidatus Bipolaricaulota bacterium]|nr:hypothetical protein [Candidatus Bipolaricaulota bacterium]